VNSVVYECAIGQVGRVHETTEDLERAKRLRHVLGVLGCDGDDAAPLPSDSNDAWRLGDVVLRICYRGDLARFEREALVTSALPASAKVPALLDYGKDDELAWQLTARVDGVTLGAAWSGLDLRDRQRAITQLGEALAGLSGHAFPAAVLDALRAPRPVGDTSAAAVIGADINPLPVPRARLLLEPAARVPGVERALLDQVAARFDELEPIDPCGERDGGTVVHGDAHPLNVLWADGVVALLDWEWVRVGARELDIEPFLYRGYESEASRRADSARIIGWLADAHPCAFADPDLVRRVWLIELAYTLRDVLIRPPDRPEHQLPTDHPLRILRRIVTGTQHLERILPRT
jgi:aminoglycoside phosphotransferase (APT) family kinase protein